MRASATPLVAGVVVAAVAVHPEHHDEDGDASQGTQDGEGLEHSHSPRSDYFEQKLTLCTIATCWPVCQFCASTGTHRGPSAQRGQGMASAPPVPRCRQHREMRTLCRGDEAIYLCWMMVCPSVGDSQMFESRY